MDLKRKFDVVVVGGGIAGLSAAVKAGRMGASVVLIEHYGFVGGMSTAGMVSPFMKHSIGGVSLVRGVFEDLERKMREMKGMIDNGFYANTFRAAAYELLTDAGVTILFHADLVGVERAGNRIIAVKVNTIDGLKDIGGDVFIDTSGDAQILFLGNFPWVKGDEKSGLLQALTLFFRMGGINFRIALEYVKSKRNNFFDWMNYDFDFSKIISVAGYFEEIKEAKEKHDFPEEIDYIFYTSLPESGEASFNTSNILDLDGSLSSDLTKAEIEGREQVNKVVRLLQSRIPGFESAYLLETAVQVGVRETRRAVGEYIINGADIKSAGKFYDSIARGCYGIDIHGQKSEQNRMEEIGEGEYYEIPLRSLIVKDAENLLAAGRCLSATREGHSALRIMPTSAANGEAAGALAALSARSGYTVRDIDTKEVQKAIEYNITPK